MAGKVRLELKAGYERELLAERRMAEALEDVARAMAAEARRLAPVRQHPMGGRYRDGIKTAAGLEDGKALARVNAEHFTSWWIEAGTSRMRPFSVLRKAMESGPVRGALS